MNLRNYLPNHNQVYYLFDLSQATSGMILRNHRHFLSVGSLKRVTKRRTSLIRGGESKLVTSKEQAKTYSLFFSSTKKQKILKTISECTESIYLL
jgi:hypothetical protein